VNKRYPIFFILLTILLSTTTQVFAKPPKKPPKPPKTATFVITFSVDICGGPFETVTKVDYWEPTVVKGKGTTKTWAIEHYSVTGDFDLEDIPLDETAPDPPYGVPDYPPDSSVCDFFDVEEPITISWLEHTYSRDYDYWHVALNQDDGYGRDYHLIVHEGTGDYDPVSDEWTVIFDDTYGFIEWWEWQDPDGPGLFHNVWKGYLTFTIKIQKLPT